MKEALAKAKEKAIREIAKGIPLIMYGSGATSFEATNLISALTVEYIANLVDAAVESSEYEFPDQQRLPPPTHLPRKKKRSTTTTAGQYFDDPLPKPKIRKKDLSTNGTASSCVHAETNSVARPQQKPYVVANKAWDTEEPKWIIPAAEDQIGQWSGVWGVDVWQAHRRPRAVTGLSSQHVLFSLCHDTYVYGRILEAQADKETIIGPILIDPVVRDTVAQQAKLLLEEERLSKKVVPKKKHAAKSKSTSAEGSDEDEEEDVVDAAPEEEEEVKIPAWPSLLGGLLPVREALELL